MNCQPLRKALILNTSITLAISFAIMSCSSNKPLIAEDPSAQVASEVNELTNIDSAPPVVLTETTSSAEPKVYQTKPKIKKTLRTKVKPMVAENEIDEAPVAVENMPVEQPVMTPVPPAPTVQKQASVQPSPVAVKPAEPKSNNYYFYIAGVIALLVGIWIFRKSKSA